MRLYEIIKKSEHCPKEISIQHILTRHTNRCRTRNSRHQPNSFNNLMGEKRKSGPNQKTSLYHWQTMQNRWKTKPKSNSILRLQKQIPRKEDQLEVPVKERDSGEINRIYQAGCEYIS